MRLGIYGGTFSPVHNGHVNAANAFFTQAALDKLLIIPVSIPPHKKVDFPVSAKKRLKMCALAFDGVGEVSDIEIRRKGKSYTYDTVCELNSLGYDDIYLLCGTDMLLTFDKWHRFDEILKKVTLAHVLRSDPTECEADAIRKKTEELTSLYGARIIDVAVDPVDISSTRIREMIARGEDASEFLPEKEYEYIKKERQYV